MGRYVRIYSGVATPFFSFKFLPFCSLLNAILLSNQKERVFIVSNKENILQCLERSQFSNFKFREQQQLIQIALPALTNAVQFRVVDAWLDLVPVFDTAQIQIHLFFHLYLIRSEQPDLNFRSKSSKISHLSDPFFFYVGSIWIRIPGLIHLDAN